MKPELAHLAVKEEEFLDYLQAQRKKEQPLPVIEVVEVDNKSSLPDALIAAHTGKRLQDCVVLHAAARAQIAHLVLRRGHCHEQMLGGDELVLHVRGNFLRLLEPVSYTHLRAHETVLDIVCRLLREQKNY